MRIHGLMQLGFKKVDSKYLQDALSYLEQWGFRKVVLSHYDEYIDETFTSWSLSKDDYIHLFGDMPTPFGTTIMGVGYRGSFYANPLITEFCEIAKIATKEKKAA